MINPKYDNNQKYLIFDGETFHLNLKSDNFAWQWSYLTCQGNNVLAKHDKFLLWENVDKQISEDAARITRFDFNSYLSKAEDPLKIINEFDKFLYNPEYIILFHNGIGFDIYIHNIMRKELGLETNYSYLDRCIDTKSLSMMYKLGLKTVDTKNLYEQMLKFNNYIQKGIKTSLGVMCKEFDIEYDTTKNHSGDYDCEVNFQMWNKLKFCFDWE